MSGSEQEVTRELPLTEAVEPPRPARARLVLLTGPEAGRTFRLGDEHEAVIGRGPSAQVQIQVAAVSRRHAAIRRSGLREYSIVDLRSSNGTALNGAATFESRLVFGDRITLGQEVELLFEQDDEALDEVLHRQRIEAIGRLAGGVAHDFNNYLGSVLANVHVLEGLDGSTQLSDTEVRAIIDDIRLAASGASALTEQLLDFSRRKRRMDRPTEVSSLVEEVLRLCVPTFRGVVEVDRELEAELVVRGDRAQLSQAVMNLCLNARDAMPDGGRLLVKVERAGRPGHLPPGPGAHGYVRIQVTDNGKGMDEEVRSRVFEPYFTTKGLGRGTGLGLASVHGIVKSHGGDVAVESKVGEGTTFFLYLPMEAAHRFREPTPVPSELATRPRRSTYALVVDSDELFVRGVQRLCEHAGFRVLAASGPAEAIEIATRYRGQVGVVLLDSDVEEQSRTLLRSLCGSARLIGLGEPGPGLDAALEKPEVPSKLADLLAELS
ncbi:MAG: FHA domain-containing protein [Deltaproteobacteria bacterium]|nr:FHA domain-containing protein [Deltaproteobacteria bacterium]